MTALYIDTSAFIAVMDRDDLNHVGASACWRRLIEEEVELHCSVGVLIETCVCLGLMCAGVSGGICQGGFGEVLGVAAE